MGILHLILQSVIPERDRVGTGCYVLELYLITAVDYSLFSKHLCYWDKEPRKMRKGKS